MASSSVQVAVRLRPINEQEKKHGTLPVVTASTAERTVTVIKGKGSRQVRQQFSFDNVFTSFSTQEEVFHDTLKPVISDVFKGYESTVFAYGQTGTGKTHTMEGDLSNQDHHGVIPRAARAIFDTLRSAEYSNAHVTCSYLEIYNEELGDLLSDGNNKVTMMEGKGGIVCRGLSEESVGSAEDVLNLMHKAQDKRHIGETKMNKSSSRSHCIFTIRVSAAVKVADGTVTLEGKLHMVDLAGSESAKTASLGDKTTGNEAARATERKNINNSLLTLGRVISILKDQSQGKKSAKHARIPYRDSKLTRILQESLGGRCKTVIIATLSPSITAIEESISTLNYAQSANGIINKPVSTSFMAAGGGNLVNSTTPSKNGAVTTESWQEMECRLQYMETQVQEAQAALGRKQMQQMELVERAERAEKEVSDREVRIGLMEKEMNALEGNLAREVDKRETAERQTRETQHALKKTTAILVATQKTESSLTSEATALLQTLKIVIAEGDRLHKSLVECKEVEKERQAATKTFREASINVLEDCTKSLGDVARQIDEHAEKIVVTAAQGYEQEKMSLSETQTLLKDIASNVKGAMAIMTTQISGESGIVSALQDMTASINAGSRTAIESIAGGESALKASCALARQNFSEHAQRVTQLESTYVNVSRNALSALEENVASNKKRVEGMVESASRALQEAKSVRAERMNAMSKLTEEWKDSSTSISDNIEGTASAQKAVLNEHITSMETEMASHDATDAILLEQNALVKSNEKVQVESLSAQSSLLSSQQSMITKAKKAQDDMRDDIMRTIMGGVQDLVNQQMQRLATADQDHAASMIQSVQSVAQTNATLSKVAEDMNERLREANSSLTMESQNIRQNAIRTKSVIEDTGKVLGNISQFASKGSRAIASYSAVAQEHISEMRKFDKESEKILQGIQADGKECARHVEKTLFKKTTQDMQSLASASEDITSFVADTVIPDASAALDTAEESFREPVSVFNKQMTEITDASAQAATAIGDISRKQVDAANSLNATIEKSHRLFTAEIAKKQQANMKSRKKELAQVANSFTSSAKATLTSSKDQTSDAMKQIDSFAAHADQEFQPAPEMSAHHFSTSLSATPAEAVILREANIADEPHHDIDRDAASAGTKDDADDDAVKSLDDKSNQDDEECISQLSQGSMSQKSLDVFMESSAVKLREITVNRSSSVSSIGSSHAKQSSIPRGKRSASRTRIAGSSPAISRKRAKRQMLSSTPTNGNRSFK